MSDEQKPKEDEIFKSPEERKVWFNRLTALWLDHSATRQVAVILAIGVCLSMFIMALSLGIAEVDRQNYPEKEVFVALFGVMSAIIGGLGVYLGRQDRNGKRNGKNGEPK